MQRTPAGRTDRERRPINAPRRGPLKGGHFAWALLGTGLGLVLCALANALARATLGPPQLIYWAGVVLIAGPIFFRLTSREASAGERLALVCMLGLGLYAVKVIRDAPLFTFSDELIHAFNAERIASSNSLFAANEILPATPYYPGLEGATSALSKLTGMSSFGAGAIVVGAARLALMAALFFLYGRISGSARTAGLAVAIYVGNFNFLFWGAQYSYESLSLPLLAVVIMALAEREATPRRWGKEWALPVLLGTVAIVVTHHLTSYALAVIVAAVAGAYWLLHRRWSWSNPWRFAVFAAALALAWTVLIATETFGYLSPVLSKAFHAIFDTASGGTPARGIFEAKETGVVATPLFARGVAVLAIGLLAAAVPFGLLKLWRRHRDNPFALIFGAAGITFFGTLVLRLAPAAWETSNRASEFLFIGLAFTIACAGFELWRPLGSRLLARGLLSAGLVVILVGGAISGWPWDLQLTSPIRAKARSNGATIVSPPLAAAEFARDNLPEDERFAANPADSRMLMVPGGKTTLAGKTPDIEDILVEEGLSGWELPLLEENGIRYLVVDRRAIAKNALKGYSFRIQGRPELSRLLPAATIAKFKEFPNAARIYSSGDVAIFDLEARP